MAPSSSSTFSAHSETYGVTITKRSRHASKSTLLGKSQHQVERRNARERKRVEAVNKGYETLARQISDWDEVKNKKLTKAETLKAAILYIQHLEGLLNTTSGSAQFAHSPIASSQPLAKSERFNCTPDSSADSYQTCQSNAHRFDNSIKFHSTNQNYSPTFYPPNYFNQMSSTNLDCNSEYGNENQLMNHYSANSNQY
ncbi:BHLH domain-containing protein [Aphelenchoides besseyi]|nr:BHLH domain-containing protein [Aphelenchoides besseyi]